MTLKQIKATYPQFQDVVDGRIDMNDVPGLFEDLYAHFMPGMPQGIVLAQRYGAAKARTGNPEAYTQPSYQWIMNRLTS